MHFPPQFQNFDAKKLTNDKFDPLFTVHHRRCRRRRHHHYSHNSLDHRMYIRVDVNEKRDFSICTRRADVPQAMQY